MDAYTWSHTRTNIQTKQLGQQHLARLWFLLPPHPPDLLPGVHFQLAFYSMAILKSKGVHEVIRGERGRGMSGALEALGLYENREMKPK